MSKKIYIVTYSAGSYEDRVDVNVRAYLKREDADAFVKEREDWQEKVRALAIKDITSYDWDDSDDSEEYPYSRLRDEFTNYVWKECFGDRTQEDISLEEWDVYDDHNSDGEFKKFMMNVKGYSEDVADATLAYNKSDEYAEYNKYYSVEEVELFE